MDFAQNLRKGDKKFKAPGKRIIVSSMQLPELDSLCSQITTTFNYNSKNNEKKWQIERKHLFDQIERERRRSEIATSECATLSTLHDEEVASLNDVIFALRQRIDDLESSEKNIIIEDDDPSELEIDSFKGDLRKKKTSRRPITAATTAGGGGNLFSAVTRVSTGAPSTSRDCIDAKFLLSQISEGEETKIDSFSQRNSFFNSIIEEKAPQSLTESTAELVNDFGLVDNNDISKFQTTNNIIYSSCEIKEKETVNGSLDSITSHISSFDSSHPIKVQVKCDPLDHLHEVVKISLEPDSMNSVCKDVKKNYPQPPSTASDNVYRRHRSIILKGQEVAVAMPSSEPGRIIERIKRDLLDKVENLESNLLEKDIEMSSLQSQVELLKADNEKLICERRVLQSELSEFRSKVIAQQSYEQQKSEELNESEKQKKELEAEIQRFNMRESWFKTRLAGFAHINRALKLALTDSFLSAADAASRFVNQMVQFQQSILPKLDVLESRLNALTSMFIEGAAFSPYLSDLAQTLGMHMSTESLLLAAAGASHEVSAAPHAEVPLNDTASMMNGGANFIQMRKTSKSSLTQEALRALGTQIRRTSNNHSSISPDANKKSLSNSRKNSFTNLAEESIMNHISPNSPSSPGKYASSRKKNNQFSSEINSPSTVLNWRLHFFRTLSPPFKQQQQQHQFNNYTSGASVLSASNREFNANDGSTNIDGNENSTHLSEHVRHSPTKKKNAEFLSTQPPQLHQKTESAASSLSNNFNKLNHHNPQFNMSTNEGYVQKPAKNTSAMSEKKMVSTVASLGVFVGSLCNAIDIPMYFNELPVGLEDLNDYINSYIPNGRQNIANVRSLSERKLIASHTEVDAEGIVQDFSNVEAVKDRAQLLVKEINSHAQKYDRFWTEKIIMQRTHARNAARLITASAMKSDFATELTKLIKKVLIDHAKVITAFQPTEEFSVNSTKPVMSNVIPQKVDRIEEISELNDILEKYESNTTIVGCCMESAITEVILKCIHHLESANGVHHTSVIPSVVLGVGPKGSSAILNSVDVGSFDVRRYSEDHKTTSPEKKESSNVHLDNAFSFEPSHLMKDSYERISENLLLNASSPAHTVQFACSPLSQVKLNPDIDFMIESVDNETENTKIEKIETEIKVNSFENGENNNIQAYSAKVSNETIVNDIEANIEEKEDFNLKDTLNMDLLRVLESSSDEKENKLNANVKFMDTSTIIKSSNNSSNVPKFRDAKSPQINLLSQQSVMNENTEMLLSEDIKIQDSSKEFDDFSEIMDVADECEGELSLIMPMTISETNIHNLNTKKQEI